MAVKVKELKDDALMNIEVNKSYYFMVKGLSFYLFNQINVEDKEAYLKKTLEEPYANLDDLQRSFYTVALLLAEIERQAIDLKFYDEKEILQPGDEDYVAPN